MTSGVNRHLPKYFWLSAILLAGSFFSCTTRNSIRGKDFIPRETFVEIVYDIHLVDGITNEVKYYRIYNPEDSIDLYGPIFEKYNVTREKYERTLDEYSMYPTLLDEVYDEVLMKLNMMQDELRVEDPSDKEEVSGGRNESLKRPGRPARNAPDTSFVRKSANDSKDK
jgi:hypothetical protein